MVIKSLGMTKPASDMLQMSNFYILRDRLFDKLHSCDQR